MKNARKVLIVIDMQNDFITGPLGTEEARAIVPKVREKIESFEGTVLFTKDTHGMDYLETQEGRLLPVPHCIKGTEGWELEPSLEALREHTAIEKGSFGSMGLAEVLRSYQSHWGLESVELVGLCTDICVISNAMVIKAALPELPVAVDASCCAGATPEGHRRALEAMAACQVEIRGAAGCPRA